MPGRRKGNSAKVGHGLASKGGGKGSKGGFHGSKGGGRGHGAGTARSAAPEGAAGGDSPGAAQSLTWLERVRKQVDFYFSSAHLRQDAFMRKKIADGDGFVDLATILKFNRIRALRCNYHPQLVQAIGKSDVLALSEDKTKVRRIPGKASAEDDSDPVPRTIYVEVIPLTFGLDMLTDFFARHGRVLLLDLPRHSQTREPRGFCFVEYSTTEEAAAAVKALHGAWPESWPARFDGRGFRAMSKVRWLEYKREFKALQQSARASGSGGSFPPALVRNAEEGHGASASDADTLAVSSTAVASTLPVSSAPSVGGKPGAQPGCLIRISGFLQPQTVLSIRQFVEHAVPVIYCDFQADTSFAVVRLRSPEDCSQLLKDLRLSQRMLGWVRPTVETMSREEEAVYWQEVEQRRSSNDGGAKNPNANDGQDKPELSKKVRSRLFRPLLSMVQNPHGVIRRGPLKTSTLKTWGRRLPLPHREMRQDGTSSAKTRVASFIDTASGSDNGVLPGFGQNFGQPRKHRKRAGQRRRGPVPPPPLPPPRTSEGEPPAKAARRTTPPPSPAVPLAPPSPACGGAAAGAANAPAIGGAKAKRMAAPNRPPVPGVPPRTPGREIPLPPASPRPPAGQNKPPSPVRPRDGAGGRAAGPSLPPPSPVAGRAAYDNAKPRGAGEAGTVGQGSPRLSVGETRAGEAKDGQDSMLEDAADILALDD